MNRTVDYSRTQMVKIVGTEDLNGYGRLFGGRLLAWIDEVGGIASRRHAGHVTTTAGIDSLQFRRPAYANDIVVLDARITWVGRSSMEVCVESFVEALDGKRDLINRAYVVYVALDENERSAEVPGLEVRTDKERADWELGEKHRIHMMKHKDDN